MKRKEEGNTEENGTNFSRNILIVLFSNPTKIGTDAVKALLSCLVHDSVPD